MAEHPRIDELRRRVQRDKASIAFAQLAEEYRRAGRFTEAIETCRTGLAHHPGYLSAHVTLGRALIEVGELQPAQDELKRVLAAAPENLAALKGLAEIHHRRGEQQEALVHYRRALDFAPHDPDLEHLVSQIARELEPDHGTADVPGGLSFAEAVGEFLALDAQAPAPVEPVVEPVVAPAAEPTVESEPSTDDPVAALAEEPPAPGFDQVPQFEPPHDEPEPLEARFEEPPSAEARFEEPPSLEARLDDPLDAVPGSPLPADLPSPPRAAMQVDALERWLDAILADRQNRN